MSDRKTATTIDEQLTRLQDRGMTITDIEHAGKVLLSVGYYRMGFYWYRFEIPEYRKRGEHRFRRDTTWEKVEALYDFDDRFRNLLSFYLQTIETDIRTHITYIVSNHYKTDPIWFVNPACVGEAFIDEFRAGYPKIKRNNDVIRKHHRKHPEDTYAPAWKTLEFLTFGEVQHLYLNILVYGSKCRLRCIVRSDKYGSERQLKAFSTKIDAKNCSMGHFAGSKIA